MPTCPTCNGDTVVTGFFPVYCKDVPADERKPTVEITCPTCRGVGMVSDYFLTNLKRGEDLRLFRIEKGYGLRQAAELIDILPSDLCDAEHGRRSEHAIAAMRQRIADLPKQRSILDR